MTGSPATVFIAEARFYADLADELYKGAVAALENANVAHQRVEVAGALELPAAIGFAARTGLFDGFIALGCVIRGETTHYDEVCRETARGLMDLSLNPGLCIGNGVLSVENKEQAWVRASITDKNKGGFAAHACLTMMALRKDLALLEKAGTNT